MLSFLVPLTWPGLTAGPGSAGQANGATDDVHSPGDHVRSRLRGVRAEDLDPESAIQEQPEQGSLSLPTVASRVLPLDGGRF